MANDTTARDELSLKIRATIEWHFGTICDSVAKVIGEALPAEVVEKLKSAIRTQGNTAIHVIDGHLRFVNIVRNTAAEPINPDRVIRRALKGKR